jgi:hypothetical protein
LFQDGFIDLQKWLLPFSRTGAGQRAILGCVIRYACNQWLGPALASRFIATVKSSSNKFALLIDGPNLNAAAGALGFEIDFKRLLAEFQRQGTLLCAVYCSTVDQDGWDPSPEINQ